MDENDVAPPIQSDTTRTVNDGPQTSTNSDYLQDPLTSTPNGGGGGSPTPPEEPPSDQEINQEIKKVQAQGKAKAQGVKPAGEKTPEPLEKEETQAQGMPEETVEPQEGEEESEEDVPQETQPGFAGTPQGAEWCRALGEQDFFRTAAAGLPELESFIPPMDRLEAVGGALADGAVDGLVDGGLAIAVDTGLNVASSKIPYAAGLVEVGKLGKNLYDGISEKGVLEGTWQGLKASYGGLFGGGEFGKGWDKITKGDTFDKIEGALHAVKGVANILDTLSSIAWTVAGLGFILSWIPGMQWLIPFVAMAAKWGFVLGGIGTLTGVLVSTLQAIVIGARAVDALYYAADGEDLDQSIQSLKENTKGFVTTATARAGHKTREKIGDSLKTKSASGGGTNANSLKPTGANPTGEKPNKLQLIADIALGTKGPKDFLSRSSDSVNDVKTSAAGMKGLVSGKNTGERISNLENAGVEVFHSNRQRESVTKKLESKGQNDTRKNQAAGAKTQERLDQAQKKVEDTKKEMDDAFKKSQAAYERKQKVQSEFMKQKDAKGSAGPGSLESAQKQLTEATALSQSYQQDLRAVKKYQGEVQRSLQHVEKIEVHSGRDLSTTKTNLKQEVTRAKQLESQTKQGIQQAEKMKVEAKTHVDMVKTRIAFNKASMAHTEAKRTAAGKGWKHQMARESQSAMDGVAATHKGIQSRVEQTSNSKAWKDLGGDGASGTHLHGHNQGSGVTGFATAPVTDMVKSGLGMGDVTKTEPPKTEAPPAAPAKVEPPAEKEPQQTPEELFQPIIDSAQQLLQQGASGPVPDTTLPNAIDGMDSAKELLDVEEDTLKAQDTIIQQSLNNADSSLQTFNELDTFQQDAVLQREKLDATVDTLEQNQEKLQGRMGTFQQDSTESMGTISEFSSSLMGFLGPFLNLMGKIPGRFIGNAGEGAGGAKQLGQVGTDLTNVSGDLGSTNGAMGSALGPLQQKSQASRGEIEGFGTSLGELETLVSTERDQTLQGQSELMTLSADVQTGMADISGERTRLDGLGATKLEEANAFTAASDAHKTETLASFDELFSRIENLQAQEL